MISRRGFRLFKGMGVALLILFHFSKTNHENQNFIFIENLKTGEGGGRAPEPHLDPPLNLTSGGLTDALHHFNW